LSPSSSRRRAVAAGANVAATVMGGRFFLPSAAITRKLLWTPTPMPLRDACSPRVFDRCRRPSSPSTRDGASPGRRSKCLLTLRRLNVSYRVPFKTLIFLRVYNNRLLTTIAVRRGNHMVGPRTRLYLTIADNDALGLLTSPTDFGVFFRVTSCPSRVVRLFDDVASHTHACLDPRV